MNTISRHGTAAHLAPAPASLQRTGYQAVGELAALDHRITYRKLPGGSRLRNWAAKPAADRSAEPEPSRTLVAKFADGPLAGSTREVTAVEGRPPKTIDLDFGDRRVRYCLAEWEQSGHTAVYGFLYEV